MKGPYIIDREDLSRASLQVSSLYHTIRAAMPADDYLLSKAEAHALTRHLGLGSWAEVRELLKTLT